MARPVGPIEQVIGPLLEEARQVFASEPGNPRTKGAREAIEYLQSLAELRDRQASEGPGPADDLVQRIARVTHEANRAFCVTLGDFSQPEWNAAPEWQRSSAMAGVRGILEGRITRPEQSHESWMAQKVADGWVYGAVKDPEAKTHPCMVPYDMLPLEQRRKDHIFFGVVRAFMALDGTDM